MPKGHKVVLYGGPEHAYKKRWICVCGTLMPRVPFGHFLYRAFADHLADVERRERARKQRKTK